MRPRYVKATKNILRNTPKILLGQRQNPIKPFPHILGRGKENLADYVTKHHLIWHHRAMRPRYIKATTKYIENSKDRQNGTGKGCDGTTNTGGTRKPDNLPKGIQLPGTQIIPLRESKI